METFPKHRAGGTEDFGAAASDWNVELVVQVSVQSLREFRTRVALRADTTLRGITDEEFAAGLAWLDTAILGRVRRDGGSTSRPGGIALITGYRVISDGT
ncbi:MAG: hypothetical protein IPI33_16615 [Dehalococcoidia bacterium]|nr:hypothetical protein [Dehalococcoidia bacterium]